MEKRKSENQLTKDSVPSEENEEVTHGFEKASEDVLKSRKICKVKRRAIPEGLPTSTNPFAGIALKAQHDSNGQTKPATHEEGNAEDVLETSPHVEDVHGDGGAKDTDPGKKTLAGPTLGGFGGLAKGAGGFGGLAFGGSSDASKGGLAFGSFSKEKTDAANGETSAKAKDDLPQPSVIPVFGLSQQCQEQTNEEAMTTGEEEENTLFTVNTASLYEFDKGQWKEKGKGILKLNKHKEKETLRLIMRQQGNLKLLLNANVWNGMKITKMEESKGMSFSCVNHLTADTTAETLAMFAVRTRDAAAINGLCEAIHTHQKP